VIFDSLQPLCAQAEVYLPTYLSSLLVPSATLQVSLVAVYHSDVPLAPSRAAISDYTPSPLTLLNYLATTIMTLHSFKQFLARKAAADRSVEAPPFGLEEGKEGVLIGLHGASTWSNVSNSTSDIRSSVIIEMEYRRKSGRSVGEWFSITAITDFSTSANRKNPQTAKENFTLLDDHPLLKIHDLDLDPASDVGPQSTFSLSLTERQKREREGVVLPYFDAQNADGEGEGGRILYDMGVEDDFDEEEDEI
jgi:elongator complex protein 5